MHSACMVASCACEEETIEEAGPHLLHRLVGREGDAQDGTQHLAEAYDLVHAAADHVHRHRKAHAAVGAAR